MNCDWIFVNQDRSRQEVTLPEPTLPHTRNGKHHAGKEYEVVVVVTDRTAQPNPLVVAVEF
jgi:hypothetical protein